MEIFNVNIREKAHFLLFLTLLWTYLSVKYKPFIDFSLNKIDNYSNLSSSVVLFCGCLYLFEVNMIVQPILYLIIIVINVAFLAFFAKTCFFIALSMVKNKKIKNLISDGKTIFKKIKDSLNKTGFDIRIWKYLRGVYENYKLENIHNKTKIKFTRGIDPFHI